jgi:hypothetical protein
MNSIEISLHIDANYAIFIFANVLKKVRLIYELNFHYENQAIVSGAASSAN